MLRFITCDDNKESLDIIANSINKIMMPYDFDYKISKFNQYDLELEKIIKSNEEQKIYILDVELPKVSGLEIASEIRENGDWESMIIFVSAHPECKDDIFYSRLMVLDFISKYFDYEKRLQESLQKVLEIYNKKSVLIFTFDYITYRIPTNKIIYIEKLTSDKKCRIVVDGGKKYEVVTSLAKIKEKLPICFYQTHKSCVVNTKKISEVDYIDHSITFNNNLKISLLSDRRKKGLRDFIGKIS